MPGTNNTQPRNIDPEAFKPHNPEDVHINLIKFFGKRPEIENYMNEHFDFNHDDGEYLYKPFSIGDNESLIKEAKEKGREIIRYIDTLVENFTYNDHIHTVDVAKTLHGWLKTIIVESEGKIKLDNPEVLSSYIRTLELLGNLLIPGVDFRPDEDQKQLIITTSDVVKEQLKKIQHVQLGFLIPDELEEEDEPLTYAKGHAVHYYLPAETLVNYPQQSVVQTADDDQLTRNDVSYDTVLTVAFPTKYPITASDLDNLTKTFKEVDVVVYSGDSSKALSSSITIVDSEVRKQELSSTEPSKEEIITTLDDLGLLETYLELFGWTEDDLDDSHDDEDIQNTPLFGIY